MHIRRWFWILALLTAVTAAQSPAATRLTVPGIAQPVTIRRDHWGIAHIYAQNEHDLFFAQGYNVAHDRLFQLELWRRQATGTLAEVLGPSAVQRDIGNRLFQYRGDLTQELNWYHPHGAAIVQAFVDGINAYVARTEQDPALLSPEFKMLRLKPGRWTPAVVITRFNGLLGNVNREINLAEAVRAIGPAEVDELQNFQPTHPNLTLDPALQNAPLTPQILAIYNAFRRPLRFHGTEIAATAQATLPPTPFDLERQLQTIGSNNWIVSGRLTPGGFPLMANDPHRMQEAPSLRYWVHLVAPGWDVIGAGEPALPGISIGHNQYGAWGLTIFGGDTEDLYVYDTNPANPLQYKYRGEWLTMQVIPTTIDVKGAAAVHVELKYTRHGPVVYEDAAHHKAYAIRAAWLDKGAAPYLASLRMDQARNWQEFRAACAYSRVPSENMVWAGVNGDIGYQAVGITPLRPNWSGLVPVPGDGRYEWDGYLPILDLPHAYNPAKGFFNTSNNYLIPNGWPYAKALHYEWADAFRARRVAEVLGSGQIFTVSDMERLQNDDTSLPARALVPLLRGLQISTGPVRDAQRQLLAWNDVLDKDSVAAATFEAWKRRLVVNLKQLLVPKAAQPYLSLSLTKCIRWLEAPDGRFGSDPIAGRDALLRKSLREAVASRPMAPWGTYHRATIFHPLSPILSPADRARFDVGDAPRSGGGVTVDATGDGPNQVAGGSFKIITDTGHWDASVGLNNPGQSGDVRSPHYRDLYVLWSQGKYFPIFFSRTKIESVTGQTLTLEPTALHP
ncbi:MAG: penicillin acylase family protein [Acidobacteria bacterium]|nr:MAG: penicillin acylase family protein [Acidobacteriota bacterium]